MIDPLDDLRQAAAEAEVEQAELARVIDVDGELLDQATVLEQLHREPDDDQVIPWRSS